MVKAAWGLPIPGNPSPSPATRSHIRSFGGANPPVVLLAIRELSNVNALASGPMSFGAEGLTVIYGDNASGKTGVARILKKAGRARDPGGSILPNVSDPDPRKPASATIEFRVGEANQTFRWVDGAPTTDELTRINVFDAKCAAVQIEESNRLAYTPEILRVFRDLAEACREVGIRLKAEKEGLEKERRPEIDALALGGATKAGLLLANLSPRTKPTEIDALCDITGEDRVRFNMLASSLRDNPGAQADLLEAHSRRLSQLESLILGLERALSGTVVQEFETLLSQAAAASEAAEVASRGLASDAALTGLGAGAWRELWESARRYSETLAYPADSFPVTREGAVCVLCQQPIDGYRETAAPTIRGIRSGRCTAAC